MNNMHRNIAGLHVIELHISIYIYFIEQLFATISEHQRCTGAASERN